MTGVCGCGDGDFTGAREAFEVRVDAAGDTTRAGGDLAPRFLDGCGWTGERGLIDRGACKSPPHASAVASTVLSISPQSSAYCQQN